MCTFCCVVVLFFCASSVSLQRTVLVGLWGELVGLGTGSRASDILIFTVTRQLKPYGLSKI